MQLAIVNVEAQTTDNIDGVDDGINKGDNNSSKQENLAHSPNSEMSCVDEQQSFTVDNFFTRNWDSLLDDKARDILVDKGSVFHSRNNVSSCINFILHGNTIFYHSNQFRQGYLFCKNK